MSPRLFLTGCFTLEALNALGTTWYFFYIYSSLFYSMDVGDTKGEHGGIHEAAIGLGCATGPAVGAAGLWLAPATPYASVWAVSGLLFGGLGLLLWVRRNGLGRRTAAHFGGLASMNSKPRS